MVRLHKNYGVKGCGEMRGGVGGGVSRAQDVKA